MWTMALIGFGSFAIEWNRVYAMRRVVADGQNHVGEQLLLFVDDPGVPIGQPAAPISDPERINAAWKQAKADRRFGIFDTIAIDKSKVCAVSHNAANKEGTLSFDLGNGRCTVLKLDGELARVILATIPESKP